MLPKPNIEGIDFFMSYFKSGNNISVEKAIIPAPTANAVLYAYNYERARAERAIEALKAWKRASELAANEITVGDVVSAEDAYIDAEQLRDKALAELTTKQEGMR